MRGSAWKASFLTKANLLTKLQVHKICTSTSNIVQKIHQYKEVWNFNSLIVTMVIFELLFCVTHLRTLCYKLNSANRTSYEKFFMAQYLLYTTIINSQVSEWGPFCEMRPFESLKGSYWTLKNQFLK